MARLLSKQAQLLASATQSGTASIIGALSSWTYDQSCSEIDTTGVADANKQYQPGQTDARGDCSVFVDPTDAGQSAIETAHDTSALVYLTYREQGTGQGLPEDQIPAYITSYSKSASVDGALELSFSWVAGGVVVHTTQGSQGE